jgi:hypothetical protein
MKNLKKLSVVFMLTALFSTSFTSCIDNEVDPIVETIYAAQADLIAAQAAVQNAEAALRLAQAAAAQAQADLLQAQAERVQAEADQIAAITAQINVETEGMEAYQAYLQQKYEYHLMQIAAETALAVAEAEMELAMAQAEFDLEMAELMAELESLGAEMATEYAYAYAAAMTAANNILHQWTQAKSDLATAELMQKNGVSFEYYIGMMAAEVAEAEANKAAIEAAIAGLEAYMEDTSTQEAMLSALKANNSALHDAIDAKEIEMQVKYNEIMAVYEENDIRDDFVDRYLEALGDWEDAVAEKEDREDWIATAEDNIAMWQAALDDYASALAALQAAADAAQAAEDAAEAVYLAAAAAEDAAEADSDAADAALAALEATLASLEASLNAAAADLAAEQAAYDAGIGAVQTALTNAEADVLTAEANLAAAMANYEIWRDRFEGGPTINGGYFWDDTTVTTAAYGDLANDVLGLQTDDTNVANDSYVLVNSWDQVAVDDNYANGYDGTVLDDVPVGGLVYVPGTSVDDAFVAAAYPNGAQEYYIEVGTDDEWWSNLAEFQAATTALGNEDIFDVPPMDYTDSFLGDGVLGGDDAYTDLWDAQLAVMKAQQTLDTFGEALAAAQALYDELKAVYENELVLLDAAQQAADDAQAVEDAAEAVEAAAWSDYNDAIAASNAADAALAAFLATTEQDLMDWIAAAEEDIAEWEHEITLIQPIIDAKQAIVEAMMEEAEGYQDLEGLLSSLYADIHAQIIALWQEYWMMEAELDALWFEHDLNAELIYAYGGWGADDLDDLAEYLADWYEAWDDACDAVAEAEAALAAAEAEQMSAMDMVAYYQAVVDTLEARYANALAIAEEYKALMEAALAS